MPGPTLGEWYASVPRVTRWHMTLLVVTAVMAQCGVVGPEHLYFTPHKVLGGQLWRLLTTFAYVGTSGSVVFMLQTQFFMGTALESGREGTVRHAWLYMLAAPLLLITAMLLSLQIAFFSFCLHTTIMFFFSQCHPDAQLSLMGLLTIPGSQLIWWSLAFNVITGQPLSSALLGIAAGFALFYSGVVERPPQALRALFYPDKVD